MKATMAARACCLLALLQGAVAVKLRGADALASLGKGPATMSKIVSLLEEMLKKSEEEQDKDKEAYTKFKCYCDDNEKEKTKTATDAAKAVGLLENEIGSLQGENGALSTDSATLKKQMGESELAVETAEELRTKEKEAFEKLEQDMTESIPMLEQAIEVLGEIGADQTLENSQAHEQFMGDFEEKQKKEELVNLKASVQKALTAATAMVEVHGKQMPEKWQKLAALLEAPMGTTYETQSGEIVGILREMKETFEENLQAAKDAEDAAIKAHDKFNNTKKDEYDKLKDAYDKGQDTMGENDQSLSDAKTSLQTEVQAKQEAEEFLEKLAPMCSEKAEEYEARKQFRANEQAAISKAIAMLNSDRAFKAFGKVDATSTGATGFVQLSSRHRRSFGSRNVAAAALRAEVEKSLFRAARASKSAKLAQIGALLVKGNAIDKVIEEIEKMKKVIEKEGETDLEQKTWCEGEQGDNEEALKTKEDDITTLKDTEIPELEDSINNPDTGFKALIQKKEETLEENTASMKEETEMRREENQNYQELAANTAEARELLEKAIDYLEKYYDETYKEGFIQKKKEDPAPPETWDDAKVMGTEEKGKEVVGMLKFVLSETEKEEETAHETEAKAQADYETSMTDLKKIESDTQEQIEEQQGLLSEAEESLIKKRAELEQTEREAKAIERYLEQIKPGCDWIIENFDKREAARGEETQALELAVTKLEATPAYANMQKKEKEDGFGDCKDICLQEGEKHAKCLACTSGVSVPGYCVTHKDAEGC